MIEQHPSKKERYDVDALVLISTKIESISKQFEKNNGVSPG